jgi:UTP--glucose-1-phosphate uridylyltransferase
MATTKGVTKAIIAVAGYGTRFLPATKNQPKEMLPIIDKPIIHHLVEECVKSGIKDIIMVTRSGQGIMEDYFDNHVELEHVLERTGKKDLLDKIREIPQLANFVYVRQKKNLPYGNGSPLITASNLIDNDEAFVYLFGDDLVLSKKPCIKQLIEVYQKSDCDGVIAVQEVMPSEVNRYGIVKTNSNGELVEIVEKPQIGKAPSNLADFGRFVLNYKTIEVIKKTKTGKGGELWLTDAISQAAKNGARFLVHKIEGRWLTTGDPLRYMTTQVIYALQRKDIGKDFRRFLKSLNL